MITEDSISDHNEKKPVTEEVSTEKNTETPAENPVEITEENPETSAEVLQETPEHQADVDTQKSAEIPQEKVLSEIDPEKADDGEPHDLHQEDELENVAHLTLPEVLQEMICTSEIRSGFRENVSVQEDTWRFRFSWYLTAVSKE